MDLAAVAACGSEAAAVVCAVAFSSSNYVSKRGIEQTHPGAARDFADDAGACSGEAGYQKVKVVTRGLGTAEKELLSMTIAPNMRSRIGPSRLASQTSADA